MVEALLGEPLKGMLADFLKKNRKATLLMAYFFFLEKKYHVEPVLFIKEKRIYISKRDLLEKMEGQGKLWRETRIIFKVGTPSVNTETKRIYICPHTGTVFGDNTSLNPQDDIYNHVASCAENTERVDGVKVKRFFISDDPAIIRNYIQEGKGQIEKIVFSSGLTGKLFDSKEAVIHDFEQSQLKPIKFIDIPNQNRFEIEESFLQFIQTHLDETKIDAFLAAVSAIDLFTPDVERWTHENDG